MDSMSMSVASLLVPSRLVELRRYLRRRLPSDLVEDVAQSAACEAWASRHNARGKGFLYGVARNEAYDAMRARGARNIEMREHDEPQSAEACVHAELGEVMDYVEARPHLQEPLRWLVREHGGDTFEDIAEEEGLSPAAVRQRVSRLRRELRAVFAVAMTAVIILGVVAAARVLLDRPEQAVALSPRELPEHAQGVAAYAPITDEWLEGSWKVTSTTDVRMLPFVGAQVEIEGGRAEVSVRGWRKEGTFARHGDSADIAVSARTESVRLRRDTELLRVETAFGTTLLSR
jgi:RNA polymerase sigma-70 factor (ECF subfamily)